LAPATVGAFYLRNSSGSFAIFAAIPRASSLVSNLAADRAAWAVAVRACSVTSPELTWIDLDDYQLRAAQSMNLFSVRLGRGWGKN
jgi:hypothetical protein